MMIGTIIFIAVFISTVSWCLIAGGGRRDED